MRLHRSDEVTCKISNLVPECDHCRVEVANCQLTPEQPCSCSFLTSVVPFQYSTKSHSKRHEAAVEFENMQRNFEITQTLNAWNIYTTMPNFLFQQDGMVRGFARLCTFWQLPCRPQHSQTSNWLCRICKGAVVDLATTTLLNPPYGTNSASVRAYK